MSKFLAMSISVVLFILWVGIRVVSYIDYQQDIGGHLKRAADANTVELASKELATALSNIEERGLTSGYTSILYRTPDEDIEFWYNNLKASHNELESITPETTQLERTNVLMKLRETLLDDGDKGSSVTAPEGISVYPMNAPLLFLGLFSFFGCLVTVIYVMSEF